MTEELIEGYLVYTDNGIERVHWCNVNGVKELVSPKGKVYGYIPDYFEVKRLQEQIKQANEIIKESSKRIKFAGVCFTSIPHQFKVKDKLFNQIEDYFKKYGINWGVK